ncbi:MAG: SDR family NAD(P)-dependent oxidoreductase [Glycocaulis sp.]
MAKQKDRRGAVDVSVNNAANDARHRIGDATPAYWDECIAVNLRHQFFATQAAIEGMRGNGQAELTGPGPGVTVRADTGMVHIFVPPEGGHCCVEPVTHRPDAVHPLTGESELRRLSPGEYLRINLCVEAHDF